MTELGHLPNENPTLILSISALKWKKCESWRVTDKTAFSVNLAYIVFLNLEMLKQYLDKLTEAESEIMLLCKSSVNFWEPRVNAKQKKMTPWSLNIYSWIYSDDKETFRKFWKASVVETPASLEQLYNAWWKPRITRLEYCLVWISCLIDRLSWCCMQNTSVNLKYWICKHFNIPLVLDDWRPY